MAPSAAHTTDATARLGSKSFRASILLLLLLVICRACSSSATRVYGRPPDSLDIDSVDLIEALEANFRGQLRNLDAIGESGQSMLEEDDDDMVYISTSPTTLDSASPDLHLPGDAVPASDLVMHKVQGFNSTAAAAAAVPVSSSRFEATKAAQLPFDDGSYEEVSAAVQEWLSRTL